MLYAVVAPLVMSAVMAASIRLLFTGGVLGVALATGGRTDPEQVLREADAAMYSVKAKVGPTVATYDRSMAEHDATQRTLEHDLEQALQRDELWLAFQPLWRLRGHDAIGAEALGRWNHPTRGLLLPGEFLPIAEQSDLSLAVGELVLARACAQHAAWQEELLATHRFRPDRLGFEISERAVVDDRVLETATALHRLGTRLAWDDFGTGFSSISHLRGWPLDIIKLDSSLVLPAVE